MKFIVWDYCDVFMIQLIIVYFEDVQFKNLSDFYLITSFSNTIKCQSTVSVSLTAVCDSK